MPGDNGSVAPGSDIALPQDGPNQGTITRASPTTFTLGAIGTYRVAFAASVDGGVVLQLILDGVAVPAASFGKWGSGSIVSGELFITTSVANSSLTLRNTGFSYIFMTPDYSGPSPIAAHLTIQQLS